MNLDFIEIGTSDFDTEIQACSDDARGISIDPVLHYLEKLPQKKGVEKVCAAISDCDGVAMVYTVPEKIIQDHDLPYWVKGCNSIDHPHPTIERLFEQYGISSSSGWDVQKIPKLSFRTLVKQYDIRSIDYLKIDTEGHDCVIMRDIYRELKNPDTPLAKPKKVLFESNILSLKADQESIVKMFESIGYNAQKLEQDILLTLIDSVQ